MEGERSESERRAAGYRAAEEELLRHSLSLTPVQRLEWLEEAQRLAYLVGAARPRRADEEG